MKIFINAMLQQHKIPKMETEINRRTLNNGAVATIPSIKSFLTANLYVAFGAIASIAGVIAYACNKPLIYTTIGSVGVLSSSIYILFNTWVDEWTTEINNQYPPLYTYHYKSNNFNNWIIMYLVYLGFSSKKIAYGTANNPPTCTELYIQYVVPFCQQVQLAIFAYIQSWNIADIVTGERDIDV